MNPTPGQNDAGDASNHHGNLSTTARFHLEVQVAGANCQLAPHVKSVNEASVLQVSISAHWKTTNITYEEFYLLAYNAR
jgi:hypothetical protein